MLGLRNLPGEPSDFISGCDEFDVTPLSLSERRTLRRLSVRRFKQLSEVLMELRELRHNDELAIRGRAVIAKILAMVVLRFVKRVERTNLGHDRISARVGAVEFRD